MILEFAEFDKEFYIWEFKRLLKINHIDRDDIEEYILNTADKYGGYLLKTRGKWMPNNYEEKFMFFSKKERVNPHKILGLSHERRSDRKILSHAFLDFKSFKKNYIHGSSVRTIDEMLENSYRMLKTCDVFYNVIFSYYSPREGGWVDKMKLTKGDFRHPSSIEESFALDCDRIKSIYDMDYRIDMNISQLDQKNIFNFYINMVFELPNKL